MGTDKYESQAFPPGQEHTPYTPTAGVEPTLPYTQAEALVATPAPPDFD